MLLAVDVRNSHIAIGVGAEGSWLARFRVSTLDRSAEEYAFLFSSLSREQGVDLGGLYDAVLSCVVPSLTSRLVAALRSLSGREPLVVGPGVKTGVRINTDNPGEVGADLVCSAAAAVVLVGAPCIVVDYGSVLTFTALDAPSDLVGVAIAPGLEVALEALRARGAQLPEVRLDRSDRAMGRNTVESIRAGVVRGWAGLVDRLVSDLSSELGRGRRVAVIGTGELVPGTEPSGGFDHWEPTLALEGLSLISSRNLPARITGEMK